MATVIVCMRAVLCQIPTVALKDMRSMFEHLSQTASAEQQQMQQMLTHKKPSKWDKPLAQKSAENFRSDEAPSISSDDREDHYDQDRELVHGSSTVFVLEDELPPPAFTRNIVAKFREMEAGSAGDKTAPEAKMAAVSSRSPKVRSIQQSSQRSGEDVTDWSPDLFEVRKVK